MPAAQTEFVVEVVRLGPIEKHPNADTLSVTNVNGYPVVIKTGSFQEGDLAVYVPVDALVPTSRPEFQFLAKPILERHRVRAARLRGMFSMGLLVKAQLVGYQPGDDVSKALDIIKYVPPSERRLETVTNLSGKRIWAKSSKCIMPAYGLTAFRRHSTALRPGEQVVITEKIHGTNARYCFHAGKLQVGSHHVFRGETHGQLKEWYERAKLKFLRWLGRAKRTDLLENEGDVWWQTAKKYELQKKLAQHPDLVVYGEIYGQGVQDLTYDSPTGRAFRVFDIYDLRTGRFLNFLDMAVVAKGLGLETVPVLFTGEWDPALVSLAEGTSTLASHAREGIVIKPLYERTDPLIGRVCLKLVGQGYLLRKES